MTILILDIKYNFEIVVKKLMHDSLFYLCAICKSNHKISCISNLNSVLLEFRFSSDNPDFFDSKLYVTKREGYSFVKIANKFLSSRDFLENISNLNLTSICQMVTGEINYNPGVLTLDKN